MPVSTEAKSSGNLPWHGRNVGFIYLPADLFTAPEHSGKGMEGAEGGDGCDRPTIKLRLAVLCGRPRYQFLGIQF